MRPKVDQRAGLLILPHLGNFRRTVSPQLPLLRKHSPEGDTGAHQCALLVRLLTTHLPTRRDGRLSWPSWLTYSGRLTHKVVTRQPWIRRRTGKVRRLQTDILTTEPRRQPYFIPVCEFQ